MLNFRINKNYINKTSVGLSVNTIELMDFTNDIENYQGINNERILVVCDCNDIDKLKPGEYINAVNTLRLNYGETETQETSVYTFDNDYQLVGINENELFFTFFIKKYYSLGLSSITRNNYLDDSDKNNVYVYFDTPHYFDITDDEIILCIRYTNINNEIVTERIACAYLSYNVLTMQIDKLSDELYKIIFNESKDSFNDETTVLEGSAVGIEIFRDNFLFMGKTSSSFYFERPTVNISIPLSNTFATDIQQEYLLNEYFVESEKKKAINKIIDIEKDVYYPSIYSYKNNKYTFLGDVYTIKFNLHFREHRGNNWLADNNSYWNGVENKKINKDITQDASSDLLNFLGFTNEDIHFQKNRLKKSFLRLSFYDSMNPANQNLLGYSTVFYNTGELFAKYVKYREDDSYKQIIPSDTYGEYKVNEDKTGIKVDREHNFEEKYRLSSQFVIKGKNLSRNSSEGFYLYLWKDNETVIPQDIYMKVEFNHAGYGRTIPFMIPFNDTNKHKNLASGSFKSFKQILNDFEILDGDKNGKAENGEAYDGQYGMRQYVKYSYLHLKYCYDKDNDIHRYFIDPKVYGEQKSNHEITINLYEAKVL